MSQWTHVNGNIRIDTLRMQGMPLCRIEDVKAHMGKTFTYDDPAEKWDECDVPGGSEGSLQFSFWNNPDLSSVAAYSVSVFGDLRDFGSPEDVKLIKEWFKKVTTADGVMVRSAILQIEVEEGDSIILTHPVE